MVTQRVLTVIVVLSNHNSMTQTGNLPRFDLDLKPHQTAFIQNKQDEKTMGYLCVCVSVRIVYC